MPVKTIKSTQRVTLTETGWEIDATLVETTNPKEADSSKQTTILLRRNGAIVCRLNSHGIASIIAVLRLAGISDAEIRAIRYAFKH